MRFAGQADGAIDVLLEGRALENGGIQIASRRNARPAVQAEVVSRTRSRDFRATGSSPR